MSLVIVLLLYSFPVVDPLNQLSQMLCFAEYIDSTIQPMKQSYLAIPCPRVTLI